MEIKKSKGRNPATQTRERLNTVFIEIQYKTKQSAELSPDHR